MFRALTDPNCCCLGFPRVRGDVPRSLKLLSGFAKFSPRTRGCSGRHGCFTGHGRVFPAYAGMFPKSACDLLICSVFPAYAGMFLLDIDRLSIEGCFPRVRGDVPLRRHSRPRGTRFSPRTRGCSLLFEHVETAHEVFPAYAGMFLHCDTHHLNSESFPRVRGDVPRVCGYVFHVGWFSPRTRGCSGCTYGSLSKN